MRQLTRKELKCKGCEYCEYMERIKVYVRTETTNGYRKARFCLFQKCPFKELNKYDTFDEYLNSPDCVKTKTRNFPAGSNKGKLAQIGI